MQNQTPDPIVPVPYKNVNNQEVTYVKWQTLAGGQKVETCYNHVAQQIPCDRQGSFGATGWDVIIALTGGVIFLIIAKAIDIIRGHKDDTTN